LAFGAGIDIEPLAAPPVVFQYAVFPHGLFACPAEAAPIELSKATKLPVSLGPQAQDIDIG
jgi:hypothetical protein